MFAAIAAHPSPIVRYWCSIDDTPMGARSLAYADAFAGMGLVVRIIATRMAALQERTQDGSPWSRHRAAFLTPIVGSFINVVCGEPDDWKRLYTVGVKNVLIAGEPPQGDAIARGFQYKVDDRKNETLRLGTDELARAVALKYQVIIVPTEEISQRWIELGATTVVVPTDIGAHMLELRQALFA
jgi:hypothetical protein